MAATKPKPISVDVPSARADAPTRKRPAVDLSLIDAQLDELFAAPEADDTENKPSARADNSAKTGLFLLLTHDQITVRPQVRQTFPEYELLELGNSIRSLHKNGEGIEGTGIVQALLVSPEGNGYRLIAGERRFRASRSENIGFLPCVVIGAVSDNSARIIQLTENALRTPPPILEEATAIKEAMTAEKLSIRDMARALGKDKSFVEGRINLLKYPIDVQAMVSARADTLRHARHLAGVKDDLVRQKLISAVLEEGIGEREVKRQISASQTQSSGKEERSLDKTPDGGSRPATLLLDKALKATSVFLDAVRDTTLDENDKQKARETRTALRALLSDLDRMLD